MRAHRQQACPGACGRGVPWLARGFRELVGVDLLVLVVSLFDVTFVVGSVSFTYRGRQTR